MSTMLYIVGCVLMLGVVGVMCDYSCLCSYQVELQIYEKPDTASNVDGYMYEFDCKPVYQIPGLDAKYSAVGNNRKLGYVLLSSNIQVQRCQGSVPDIDKVIITTGAPTTTTTTTTTTTPKPTTTRPTTPTRPTVPTTATTKPAPITTTPLPTTVTTTPVPTPAPTTPVPTTTTTLPPITTTTQSPITTPLHGMALCQSFIGRGLASLYGGSCYEYVNRTGNWATARKDCHAKGGYLVSILNQDQQNFVGTFLQNIHVRNPLWIGFTDAVKEEQWVWDSGSNSTFRNWMPGRFIAQDHNVEDCGLFVPLRMNQWDDVICSGYSYGVPASYPWICQYS